MRVYAVAVGLLVLLAGCNTVDLGDNFTQGEVAVNDDFFYCRVQPEVISAYSCSEGAAGEGGMCHGNMSAMRLRVIPTLVGCDADGVVAGTISPEERNNFEAARAQVSGTSSNSPLLLRPIGVQSHPRTVFAPADAPADVLRMWIDGAGP